ncbi:hypothetical protein J2Z66_007026 [Paenibacillus eucommiae]|uniref:Uncharacterized protein n=1 Tax=Paenibacillus eucommiae TaxID=1355755 RepID=A0ABS4J9J0_9BACL|nr:hypothetical protein [Paenibacillus eucommiae]
MFFIVKVSIGDELVLLTMKNIVNSAALHPNFPALDVVTE